MAKNLFIILIAMTLLCGCVSNEEKITDNKEDYKNRELIIKYIEGAYPNATHVVIDINRNTKFYHCIFLNENQYYDLTFSVSGRIAVYEHFSVLDEPNWKKEL